MNGVDNFARLGFLWVDASPLMLPKRKGLILKIEQQKQMRDGFLIKMHFCFACTQGLWQVNLRLPPTFHGILQVALTVYSYQLVQLVGWREAL